MAASGHLWFTACLLAAWTLLNSVLRWTCAAGACSGCWEPLGRAAAEGNYLGSSTNPRSPSPQCSLASPLHTGSEPCSVAAPHLWSGVYHFLGLPHGDGDVETTTQSPSICIASRGRAKSPRETLRLVGELSEELSSITRRSSIHQRPSIHKNLRAF